MKLKTILAALVICLCAHSKAQLIKEATYKGGTFYMNGMNSVFLSNTGSDYKWIKMSTYSSDTIWVYNMNHSLYKQVLLNNLGYTVSQPQVVVFNLSYYFPVTETMVNNDSKLEFFIRAGNSVMIVNEDGALLQKIDSLDVFRCELISTPTGVKMIAPGSKTTIYSLPGSLPLQTTLINNNSLFQSSKLGQAFPNPVTDVTRINYTLPPGESTGSMIIYDINGNEVKIFQVDKTFDHLMLSTDDLASGTYFYSLQANGSIIESKKMILIK